MVSDGVATPRQHTISPRLSHFPPGQISPLANYEHGEHLRDAAARSRFQHEFEKILRDGAWGVQPSVCGNPKCFEASFEVSVFVGGDDAQELGRRQSIRQGGGLRNRRGKQHDEAVEKFMAVSGETWVSGGE